MTAPELLEVLEDSVRMHLVADVPVSTFLSGGLDSSLITVLAARSNPQIDAYTISFRPADQRLEAMPDDLQYARIVARRHGLDLHEIRIEPDVVSMLPKMVYHLDEPIGDAAAINTYLICTAARAAGAKVLLSGMGADELFGGYRKHYACLLAARYRRLPHAVRHAVVSPIVGRLPVSMGSRGLRWSRWAKRFVAFADLPEEAAFRRSYTIYGRDELARLLDPSLMPTVDQLFDEHSAVYWGTGFDDPVNRMCMTDVQLFLTGLNLAYTDRASMAASTEVRVPFVDVEVATAAFNFSASDKIDGRTRKAILRKASEGVLPSEVIHRPKGLFSAPLRAWVRRDLAPMVDDMLLDGELIGIGSGQPDRSRADDQRGPSRCRRSIEGGLAAPDARGVDPSDGAGNEALRRRRHEGAVKQLAQRYRTGDLTIVDVPVPMCASGGVLVRTEYSLISPGTELMKVEESRRSMLGKVRARPDQVRRVLDTAAQQGPHAALKKVMHQLDSYTPLGYSLCGTVVEVGDGVTDLVTGQRVACAGNQFALHSELNWIPFNLCAVVPEEVDARHAAFTTVGAVALQGLRQAELGLGEVAVVIGLGIDRPAARPAPRGRRRADAGHRHLRGEVPARHGDGRRHRRPPRIARGAHRLVGGTHGRRGRRCRVPRGGKSLQRARRDRRTGGARSCSGHRHRQVLARPSMERLLREGARRSLLALLRARTL